VLDRFALAVLHQDVVAQILETGVGGQVPDFFVQIADVGLRIALQEHGDRGQSVVVRDDVVQIGVRLAPDVRQRVLGPRIAFVVDDRRQPVKLVPPLHVFAVAGDHQLQMGLVPRCVSASTWASVRLPNWSCQEGRSPTMLCKRQRTTGRRPPWKSVCRRTGRRSDRRAVP
jgi:hypothetical protein